MPVASLTKQSPIAWKATKTKQLCGKNASMSESCWNSCVIWASAGQMDELRSIYDLVTPRLTPTLPLAGLTPHLPPSSLPSRHTPLFSTWLPRGGSPSLWLHCLVFQERPVDSKTKHRIVCVHDSTPPCGTTSFSSFSSSSVNGRLHLIFNYSQTCNPLKQQQSHLAKPMAHIYLTCGGRGLFNVHVW